jgi:ribosomal protein L37AE/L43A
MLFRRAVAAVAKEETVKKPKTRMTLKKANAILGFTDEEVALAENRRLRGEVRRLRRALRGVVRQTTPPKNAIPEVCWECGEAPKVKGAAGFLWSCRRCMAMQRGTMSHIAEAALAPRRRSK